MHLTGGLWGLRFWVNSRGGCRVQDLGCKVNGVPAGLRMLKS